MRSTIGGNRALVVSPLDGSRPPLVLDAEHDVGQIVVSPRNDRVVYTVFEFEGKFEELFSVPIDGLEPPVALDPLANMIPGRFALTPDGSRVVYTRNGALHSIAIDGSTPPVPLSK